MSSDAIPLDPQDFISYISGRYSTRPLLSEKHTQIFNDSLQVNYVFMAGFGKSLEYTRQSLTYIKFSLVCI